MSYKTILVILCMKLFQTSYSSVTTHSKSVDNEEESSAAPEHNPHWGVVQDEPTTKDSELYESFLKGRQNMVEYMQGVVWGLDEYESVRDQCRNEHSQCLIWASQGKGTIWYIAPSFYVKFSRLEILNLPILSVPYRRVRSESELHDDALCGRLSFLRTIFFPPPMQGIQLHRYQMGRNLDATWAFKCYFYTYCRRIQCNDPFTRNAMDFGNRQLFDTVGMSALDCYGT